MYYHIPTEVCSLYIFKYFSKTITVSLPDYCVKDPQAGMGIGTNYKTMHLKKNLLNENLKKKHL